jgi:hypothetical protein
MLEYARRDLAKQSADVQKNLSFQKSSIEEFNAEEFDSMLSLGVIGYMPTDDSLFELASRVLRKNGYYIVSFRNRLFNLFSISERTVNEANSDTFSGLVHEASELYKKVDKAAIKHVLKNLHEVAGQLLKDDILDAAVEESPSVREGKTYRSEIEARQTTPAEAIATAQKFGFAAEQLYGVHPHLAVPGLNHLLPPLVYNRLCDSLIPLESSPVSLLWSSVFIGVFKKVK